jgi:hypothetical protein
VTRVANEEHCQTLVNTRTIRRCSAVYGLEVAFNFGAQVCKNIPYIWAFTPRAQQVVADTSTTCMFNALVWLQRYAPAGGSTLGLKTYLLDTIRVAQRLSSVSSDMLYSPQNVTTYLLYDNESCR